MRPLGEFELKYPREQFEYDDFLSRWREIGHSSFPSGCAGEVVAGVELVLFDVDLDMLLDKYADKRQLSEGAVRVLQEYADRLSRVLPHLGGDAAIYFSEMHELATAVLRMVRRDDPTADRSL